MMQLSCTVDLMSSQSQLLLLLTRRGVVAVVNAVAIAVVFHLHCGRRGDAISQSPQVLRRRFKHNRMSLDHQKPTYQRLRLAQSHWEFVSIILADHTATQGDKY